MSKTHATELSAMRTPEQVFRAYCASMTDSDLLSVAINRDSFIQLIQALLAEELEKRRIVESAVISSQRGNAFPIFTRMWQIIRPEKARLRDSQEPALPRSQISLERTVKGPRSDHSRVGHVGATEDQVSMVGTLPERLNGRGIKLEDIAGRGEHDSLGG